MPSEGLIWKNLHSQMTLRPIAKVVLDTNLGLLVIPKTESHEMYEYIYRAANGLRWNPEHHAFCAYEPKRWEPEELLQHIAATVVGELGEQLHFTQQTSWHGISPELERKLRNALQKSDRV